MFFRHEVFVDNEYAILRQAFSNARTSGGLKRDDENRPLFGRKEKQRSKKYQNGLTLNGPIFAVFEPRRLFLTSKAELTLPP